MLMVGMLLGSCDVQVQEVVILDRGGVGVCVIFVYVLPQNRNNHDIQ
jgi:hypothetical protein